MEKKPLNVGLLQLSSVDDPERNIKLICELLLTLESEANLDMLVLPEMSLFMRLNKEQNIPDLQQNIDLFKPLSDWCRKKCCLMLLGSCPFGLGPSGLPFNTMLVIDTQGNIHPVYQKMHLFDLDLGNEQSICESAAFSRGSVPAILRFRQWQFGLSICYDLRFAQMYSVYRKAQVDTLLVPSAFTVKTGTAHWEVLLRARAIESQCYVLAPAQAGRHSGRAGTRYSYGHSLAIDPWGDVLACKREGVGFMRVQLMPDRIDSVRQCMPMASMQRLGVFPEPDLIVID